MRWERLFSDLESRADALAHAERSVEIAERTRIEAGRLKLVNRLAASQGAEVAVRLAGNVSIKGRLRRTGVGWLLVADSTGAECLVMDRHVLVVTGLTQWSAPVDDDDCAARVGVGVGQALRALSQDRARVTVHVLDGGAVSGTIERVGNDFIELTVRGPGDIRTRGAMGVAMIRSDAASMIRRAP